MILFCFNTRFIKIITMILFYTNDKKTVNDRKLFKTITL